MDLDVKRFVPPRLPDDQNFCATPFWRYVFSRAASSDDRFDDPATFYEWAKRARERFSFDQGGAGWWSGRRVELATYAKSPDKKAFHGSPSSETNLAELGIEILRAMEPFEPVRQEMLAAAARPGSRFDV